MRNRSSQPSSKRTWVDTTGLTYIATFSYPFTNVCEPPADVSVKAVRLQE
jgi:hypothetical protein